MPDEKKHNPGYEEEHHPQEIPTRKLPDKNDPIQDPNIENDPAKKSGGQVSC